MVEVLATRFLGASRVALLACMCVDSYKMLVYVN